jgi:hypothetical protein
VQGSWRAACEGNDDLEVEEKGEEVMKLVVDLLYLAGEKAMFNLMSANRVDACCKASSSNASIETGCHCGRISEVWATKCACGEVWLELCLSIFHAACPLPCCS